MGVGMVWFVPASNADASLKIARECGFEAHIVGEVVAGDRDVTVL
jgi:phosphoribosylaminoimidazole (AIR) synthetase